MSFETENTTSTEEILRHKARHKKLHSALDELVADYLEDTKHKLPSKTTVLELLQWSAEQCK